MSILELAISYFATISIFAFIYWVAWQARQDSFIIHQEFTLSPFNTLINILWRHKDLHGGNQIYRLDEIHKEVRNDIENYNSLNKELESLTERINHINEEFSVINKELSEIIQFNQRKYGKDQLEELESEVKGLKDTMEYIANQEENTEYNTHRYIISDLKLKISEAQLVSLKKMLIFRNTLLKIGKNLQTNA